MLKKIVVIGPESTGKSTLCSQLAAHYGTDWVREYARGYLLEHGTDYSFDDLLTIAQGQVRLEEEAELKLQTASGELEITDLAAADGQQATKTTGESGQTIADPTLVIGTASLENRPSALFIDTDMHVMQVWCEFVFGQTHAWIEEQLQQRKYDLYLLCNTNLPWVKDELREYPDMETREKLFAIYKERMQRQTVPWVEIGGTDGERLQRAITAVDNLLASA